MLYRNLKHVLSVKTLENCSLITSRQFSRRWADILFATNARCKTNMSSSLKLRQIIRNLVVARLFGAWTRSFFASSVVRRCRRDVVQCFRQTLLRPRRTLLFTVTAAYKNNEEKPGPPGPCANNITDEEMKNLVVDLESVEDLSKATLYCPGCERRVVINNAQPGIRYCECDPTKSPEQTFDGWEPFLEAEDIIIWRKEYKPGPLYAYKVYGRYKHLRADDFAAIQVDGGYRKVWDTAVAALSVVESDANGLRGQAVLYWEVLWPRFFANRDYVYLRRHKEFDLKSGPQVHKDRIFDPDPPTRDVAVEVHCRPNVHSNAKRKAQEDEEKIAKEHLLKPPPPPDEKPKPPLTDEHKEQLLKPPPPPDATLTDNKVYVIVSRSCTHQKVPVTSSTIRVAEYWSHMVVKTLHGPDKEGDNGQPDFAPFSPEKVSLLPDNKGLVLPVSELEMETSQQGPEMGEDSDIRDQATQTDTHPHTVVRLQIGTQKNLTDVKVSMTAEKLDDEAPVTLPVPEAKLDQDSDPKEGHQKQEDGQPRVQEVSLSRPQDDQSGPQVDQSGPQVDQSGPQVDQSGPQVDQPRPQETSTKDDETVEEESEEGQPSGWWRYLYPFYYFA